MCIIGRAFRILVDIAFFEVATAYFGYIRDYNKGTWIMLFYNIYQFRCLHTAVLIVLPILCWAKL